MKEKQVFTIIKYVASILLFGIIFYIAYKLLGEDVKPFAQWWFTLLVLGIVFYPMAGIVFKKFHDGGWLFSKTIGLAISGWLLWFLSSLKLFRFTSTNAWICVGICLAFNLIILAYQWGHTSPDSEGSLKDKYNFSHNKLLAILLSEAMFLILFLLWCYMRGFKPEAYGTEKFMDYGFMTTMMRAEYMPPEDLWFSGNSINYYYVGQYMATYMTKLSGVLVSYGYNLMMMTLAAFGFVLPYSIVYNVAKVFVSDLRLRKRNTGKQQDEYYGNGSRSFIPSLAGLTAGTAVCFAGNLHYPIYKWIVPFINKMKGIESTSYWFPNATRYIGYNPETTDKTIHEFPVYSFVLGDLHAHVINIIFVLTVLALLFAFLMYRKDKMDSLRLGITIPMESMVKEVFHPTILLLGFFIGLFRTTNFWDFPIYFVVSGAIILFSNAVLYQFKKKTIILTALHAVVVFAIGEFTALPFTLNFNQISTKICLTVARTPIYQLLILWGLPIILVIIYIMNRWSDLSKEGYITGVSLDSNGKKKSNLNSVADEDGKVTFVPEKNKLFQFIENLPIADLFMVTIGLCAIGLILMPEVIYVQDIYSGDYKRANTMFKLTYQAFIMFGLSISYIMVRYILISKNLKRRVIGVIAGILFISTVCYANNAIKSWYGDISKSENYKTLDASAFMEKESMDDYLATKWLNENVTGMPVVLEAQGDSYTFYQRVSVITGLPTVMGWKTHEWLWRSDETGAYPAICEERANDIDAIYNAQNVEDAKILLEKYNVSYIYVGALEREKYVNMNETVLGELGEVVFEVASDENQLAPTYIIKIK